MLRVSSITVQVHLVQDDGTHLSPGPPLASASVGIVELVGSPLYEQITTQLAKMNEKNEKNERTDEGQDG